LNRRFCFLLLALLVSACAPLAAPAASPVPSTATATLLPPTPTPSPTVVPLDLTTLKNGTYTLSSIDNLQVTLVDGKFDVSDPAKNLKVSGQLIEPAAFGDLNGDGVADAALMIAANSGGSGTFHILIVVLAQKGQAASQLVGDRIQEKLLTIQRGKIILEYLRAGPNDPLCCPSEHARTTYQLNNAALEKVADQVIP
jgi:hypothetical protein